MCVYVLVNDLLKNSLSHILTTALTNVVVGHMFIVISEYISFKILGVVKSRYCITTVKKICNNLHLLPVLMVAFMHLND